MKGARLLFELLPEEGWKDGMLFEGEVGPGGGGEEGRYFACAPPYRNFETRRIHSCVWDKPPRF